MFELGSVAGYLNDGTEVFVRSDKKTSHIHVNYPAMSQILKQVPIPFTGYARVDCIITEQAGQVNRLAETTEDDICIMYQRNDREGKSRMVLNRIAPPTTKAFIALCSDVDNGGRCTIITCFAGDEGMREPWDKSLKTQDQINESIQFWKHHALIPTPREQHKITFEVCDTLEVFRAAKKGDCNASEQLGVDPSCLTEKYNQAVNAASVLGWRKEDAPRAGYYYDLDGHRRFCTFAP